MAKHWKTEAEMAAALVAWLRADGFKVYQEVMCGWLADIVAEKDKKTWVIEAKLSLNLKVLEQGARWLTYADRVSIATPQWNAKLGHDFARGVCHHYGMGALIVYPNRIDEVVVPKETKPRLPRLFKSLCPEQETYAAAGTNRGHWTPFKGFARDLAAYVRANPGVSVKEAESAPKVCSYYPRKYAFRRNVPPLAQKGAIPGVQARYDEPNGVWRLWPEDASHADLAT